MGIKAFFLKQWFPTVGDFSPQGTLVMSVDIFDGYDRGEGKAVLASSG